MTELRKDNFTKYGEILPLKIFIPNTNMNEELAKTKKRMNFPN